ncbi:DNA integrity scanning diadenylate cyclase DisA [Bacillaceae bacterium S4-13-58]
MVKDLHQETTPGEILKSVAPGTPLRAGIDSVLRANTGGLIVIGESEHLNTIVDGGFAIDTVFSPAHLFELAKMDGAIILSKKGERILRANAQLIPNPAIDSDETGMRHRTAERVAKETGHLVIAISERRNVITLYKGQFRYALRDMDVILTKANQAIQTLEKYKHVLTQGLTNLGALEFEDMVTFYDVLQVIHRTEMVLRIKEEVCNYSIELGVEGRLIELQLSEIMSDIEEEAYWVIKDYHATEQTEEMLISMKDNIDFQFHKEEQILRLLGFPKSTKLTDSIRPRGYRMLRKIPRLPLPIIASLVREYGALNRIIKRQVEQLTKVEGIGEGRARQIKEGLDRIQEQLFVDRHI